MADVGAFHIHDTFVAAQRPRKLSIAHVHSIYLYSSVLKHAVGETACRRADIHANLSLRGKRKHLHRLFQLQSTAAHISDIMAPYFHVCIFVHHIAGLVAFFLAHIHNARHDERFCTLPALRQAVLAKILIQSNFHLTSPCFVIAAARDAASNPKRVRNSSTEACVSPLFGTAICR